jgi:G3E family GTPase
MRIVMVAGFPGSRKTALISRMVSPGTGVIVNNPESVSLIPEGVRSAYFPMRSPCARPRQFLHWIEKVYNEWGVDTLITEPPGMCTETSSRVLAAVLALRDERFEVGPLITVFKGGILVKGISSDTSDGLRMRQQISESDIVVISAAEDIDRDDICGTVHSLNPDADIHFFSETGGSVDEVRTAVYSDRTLSRALNAL